MVSPAIISLSVLVNTPMPLLPIFFPRQNFKSRPQSRPQLTLWTKSKTGTRKSWFRLDCAHAFKFNNSFWTCAASETAVTNACSPSDWPFTMYSKTPIYRRTLGRVRPDHNSKMAAWRIANGNHLFHLEISVINFRLTFKAFRLFRKFPDRSSQICSTIYIFTEMSGIVGKW